MSESRWLSRRGNITIWLVVIGVALFKTWQYIFGYPGDSIVVVVPGLLKLKTSTLAGGINFFFGWIGLAAVVTIANSKKIVQQLFRPFELIQDEKSRRFFGASSTLVIAALFFLGIAFIAAWNWSLSLNSQYEVNLAAPPGQNAFFVEADRHVEEVSLTLTSERPVRIGGLTPGRLAVVVIRDKYNLRTLDVLCIERRILAPPAIDHCDLDLPADLAVSQGPDGIRKTGFFTASVVGGLRWAAATVNVPFVFGTGERGDGAWITPGDPRNGAEDAPYEYARRFLRSIHSSRAAFRNWTSSGAIIDPSRRPRIIAFIDGGYRVEMTFADVPIIIPTNHGPDWRPTVREAIELVVFEPAAASLQGATP